MAGSSQSSEGVDTAWKFIEDGVKQILAHAFDKGGLDTKTYMGLSTAIHRFCTAKEGIGSDLTQGNSRSNRGEAYLLGKELYERLKQLLITHLEEINNEAKAYSNEALLSFHKQKREHYTLAAKQNNHLFNFLNQHWVKREIMEGKKDIYDIYRLHLVLWEEVIVTAAHPSVADVPSQ